MKEYLAATQPMEKSYDELTLEEKFGALGGCP